MIDMRPLRPGLEVGLGSPDKDDMLIRARESCLECVYLLEWRKVKFNLR